MWWLFAEGFPRELCSFWFLRGQPSQPKLLIPENSWLVSLHSDLFDYFLDLQVISLTILFFVCQLPYLDIEEMIFCIIVNDFCIRNCEGPCILGKTIQLCYQLLCFRCSCICLMISSPLPYRNYPQIQKCKCRRLELNNGELPVRCYINDNLWINLLYISFQV
jgi:hypothetical protein